MPPPDRHDPPPGAAAAAHAAGLPGSDAAQAGALLRAARQQQGLHIAALATSIKVTPAKLEALEAGRIDLLPDATFARALAQTICRVLKIDPAPVLALLPGAPQGGLARVDAGLNTPFRERAGHGEAAAWLPWRHPVLWLVLLLLAAAAAFVLVPSQPGLLSSPDAATTPVLPPPADGSGTGSGTPAQPGDAASASPVSTMLDAGSSLPAVQPALATATGAAPGASLLPLASASAALAEPAASAGADATLVLRAVQATWVQATDASGQVLMARLVPAGETVALSPALPVRLRIGNVQGTVLQFRGQPVNLPASRENVANLTLP